MNKRINELKSQCIVREQRGTNAFDSYVVDRFDTEKFAQLIVRDCKDLLIESSENNRLPIAVDDMVHIIDTHFRVEE